MIRRFACRVRRARRLARLPVATSLALMMAAAPAALALPAERISLMISGRVFDHTGAAVKRATVRLEGANATSTLTAEDGRYTLAVPLDGLRESAPHTVVLALHVQHGGERFTLADGSDTVRVELAVLPGQAGANVMMRSNSEAALGAVLGALKTSSGRGEFRGDQATLVGVQLLFFGRSRETAGASGAASGTVSATSGSAMPFQDSAFLEGVEAAQVQSVPGTQATPVGGSAAPAAGAASLSPARPPAAAPPGSSRTPQRSTASSSQLSAAPTRAPALAADADSAATPHAAKTSAPTRAPATPPASETHAIGGMVSTTGTMSKIFSSPSGGIPLLTPGAPDSAALARALSPCECRVEGTIEVDSNQPLPRPFSVIVSLADDIACRDTVALFMGPPRTFTLSHVPCGSHRLDVGLPKSVHLRLSGAPAAQTADCARGQARAVHLVLTRHGKPPLPN